MPGRVHETQRPGSENSDALEVQGFHRGVDNRSPETSLPEGAAREIQNADVYRDGNVQRRVGYSLVSSVTSGHSLWTTPELEYALFIDNGVIKKLNQHGNISTLDNAYPVSPSRRMSWVWYNDIVYFSNGMQTGRIVGNSAYSWGQLVPEIPTLTAATGDLPAGEYCVTLVNVTDDGEESGAPMAATITLTDGQAISLTTRTASGISYVDIYVTPTNGDKFYKAGRATAGDSFTISSQHPRGKLLQTQFGREPYAGNFVAAHNGRLYLSTGKVVWYTDPLSPNIIFPRTNFLLFENDVTMIAPVVDGIYIGTEKRTYWLNGGDPTGFRQNLTQPYGVVKGTNVQIPGDWFVTETVWPNQGYAQAWRNTEGVLCVGRLEGFVQKIGDSLVKLTDYEEGASTVIRRDGLQQVLSSLWNAGDSSAAFGDSVTAEVVSNGLS